MKWYALIHIGLGLVGSPLLLGIMNRVKAFFAGRRGPALVQPYYDLWKLLRKGNVYSRTTTWIFTTGPMLGLAAVLTALTLMPFGGISALISFKGDLILFVYLLGITRFFTVLAGLDTGSSLEGMGASREVQFSALVEPALLLGLTALALETRCLSLSVIYRQMTTIIHPSIISVVLLVMVAFFFIFLTENARIPVDDPNTHLELTMVHEVMVLDHSGIDLAIIQYTAALKHWIFGLLIAGLAVPIHTGEFWLDTVGVLGGIFIVAVLVGVVESTLARFRLIHIPKMLVAASVLSVLAMILVEVSK